MNPIERRDPRTRRSGKVLVPALLYLAGAPLGLVLLLWFFFFRGWPLVARRFLHLINHVLDISRIEADQFEVHPEPFDLRASIERVTSLIRPLADKQGLRLDVTMEAGIDGMISDRRRVEQILINLLSNAVKFTERGGVQLSVSLASSAPELEPTRDLVRIEVRDTGIGIGPADLAKLFQPFKQLDSGLGRHREGTGPGLAICRRLASMLGGDVKVESVLGVGTTFTLTLPLFATCEAAGRVA